MQNQQTAPQTSGMSNQIHDQLPTRGSAYYRIFKQVVGLFDALPLQVIRDPDNDLLVHTFGEIKNSLYDKFRTSRKNLDIASITAELFQLEVILVKLLPVEDLIFKLEGYRQEFQHVIGENAYLVYLNSVGYRHSSDASTGKLKSDKFIRADAIYLITQLQNYQIRREGAESARSYLLSRLWRYTNLVIVILSVPIIVFFADLLYFRSHGTFSDNSTTGQLKDTGKDSVSSNESRTPFIGVNFFQPATPQSSPVLTPSPTPDGTPEEQPTQESPQETNNYESPTYVAPPGESRFSIVVAQFATLGFVCIAGALGAFVSAASRIQRLGLNHELMRNTLGLESLAIQLKWTPIIGLIFAFILSLVFGGGLVQGGLFPGPGRTRSWLTMLYDHTELAKLLVWCFIAGFSERFVPDLLDRLLLQSKGNAPTERAQQPTIVVTEPPNITNSRKNEADDMPGNKSRE